MNDIAANRKGVDAVVAELNKINGEDVAIGVTADVTKPEEVRSMVEESVQRLGPLTVMVANAGISGKVKPVLELTQAEFQQIVDVNILGTFHCYQAAAKQMIAQGPAKGPSGYRIIGASSIVAVKPPPMSAH